MTTSIDTTVATAIVTGDTVGLGVVMGPGGGAVWRELTTSHNNA